MNARRDWGFGGEITVYLFVGSFYQMKMSPF